MRRSIFLLSALLVASVLSQSQYTNDPDYITLPVIVHDYFPCTSNEWVTPPPNGRSDLMTMANCMADVEPYQTSATRWGSGLGSANKGMVKSTLGSNRKPIYDMPAVDQTSPKYQTLNSDTYNRWWDSSWAGNWPIKFDFNLKLNKDNGLYTISTDSFYPIDNQGWGNNGYSNSLKIHNWGFCVEAHANFVYNSSAVLNFRGDDDMWIFMNNQLVFDIGGIHTPVEQKQKLGDFNWATKMVDFQSYPFDMFYCERQTAGSNIILTTTVNIYCPNNQYDACGVCQGKGDCCPKCANPDKCTIATLNPKNCNCTFDTTTIPKQCAAQTDQCSTVACDASVGCKRTDRPTPYFNGCQGGYCDTTKGWIITNNATACYTNDTKCFPVTCTPGAGKAKTCNRVEENQCVGWCSRNTCPSRPCNTVQCFNNALNPNTTAGTCNYTSTLPGNNTCFGYTCAADNSTYITTPLLVCTNSSNLCYTSICDPDLRNCTARIYKNCSTSNLCKIDSCVEATGECSSIDVTLPSQNNTCVLASCDPDYGITATNISCKGIDCRMDPTTVGCCYCRGIPLGAILGAGAIAGIAVGGAAAAAIAGFGGKKAYDFFQASAAAGGGVQNNPMYVANGGGADNPMYSASA